MLDISIDEKGLTEATRAVMHLPGLFARARASALASLGWHVQQDLKHARIEPPLHPITGVLSRRKGRTGQLGWIQPYRQPRYRTGPRKGQVRKRRSARREPFSRLKNMVRYSVDKEDGIVEIGLLNPKPWYYTLMRRHAEGYSVRVTPRMRRMMFAVGFPLKEETTRLHIPARPWVRSVAERWKRKAAPLFEEKFWAALKRYFEERR